VATKEVKLQIEGVAEDGIFISEVKTMQFLHKRNTNIARYKSGFILLAYYKTLSQLKGTVVTNNRTNSFYIVFKIGLRSGSRTNSYK
jgi:hypothetical protein